MKVQNPWGTCWAFAATAASESSILTKMESTYTETGLDLSERYLAWYVAQPVTKNISTSQAGEGLHLYDENPNYIFLYGGKDKCAGTLYAQGIGPVPESDYPYRGLEGNLNSDALPANKDAYIEAALAKYKLANPFAREDTLRSRAEKDYEYDLARYAVYDTYSQFDDWTISEAGEPGSGRLRGAPYTLTDNNVFVYWIMKLDRGIDEAFDKSIDEFGKEPLIEIYVDEKQSRALYQDSIDQIKKELLSGRGISVDFAWSADTLNTETWAQYGDGTQQVSPHAVCIVGWDDDYDSSNFKVTPPGNGAWIVKNSFGSQTDIIPGGLVAADGTTRDANSRDWGIVDENGLHTGYFYLSYYDTSIGVPESYDFDLCENHDQENALQLDYMPAATDTWVHTGPVISPSVTVAPSGIPTGAVKPTSATPTRGASGTPTGTVKQVSAVPTRGASGNTGVSNSAVKNASATPAAKTSKPSATKSASVSTGDDNDPALWFTLLTAALTGMAAMFTLRRSRRSTGR